MGAESLSAYIISMARNPSDVLAVELLKREARFLVSGRHNLLSSCVPAPGNSTTV